MPEIRHFLKYFQKHLLNAISPEEFFELEYGTDNWAEVIIHTIEIRLIKSSV